MHIFYDQELTMIAQLQMTMEYFTNCHKTNTFHYNSAIHNMLGIQLFGDP